MTIPFTIAAAVLAGLIVSPVLLYIAPRLMTHRLENQAPPPGPQLLVPVAGPFLMNPPGRRYWLLLFEVTLAFFFGALAYRLGPGKHLLIALFFTGLLALISVIDLEHRLVLNILSLPGLVAAIALSPLWVGLLSSIEGAAAGFALFTALTVIGRGRLGFGDAKLAAVIGAMRGFPGVLGALYVGVLLGGVAALVYLVVLRRGRKDYFAYAPYLAAGAVIAFLFI
ncbi:MAG TPA: A24 family peptidase [Chloroflexota bacterium]|nr:A24 family peptidase [Chloroflexota bacterium]